MPRVTWGQGSSGARKPPTGATLQTHFLLWTPHGLLWTPAIRFSF